MDKITGPFLVSGATGSLAIIGGAIASAFGGWDSGMIALLIFMGADYITGMIVAGVFKASQKTETGALESRAGWKGLLRKGVTLLIVLVAAQLDQLLNASIARDAVVIAYIVNELISIIENAGLMGVPIPKPLEKAIDILRSKSNDSKEEK